MTTKKLKQLEDLFSELSLEFGAPICILNGQVYDGWHVGIYEVREKGKVGISVGRQEIGASLEQIVNTLKSW